MRNLFQNFRKTESGATLVEYGVALILAIVVGGGALVTLANDTSAQYDRGCDAFTPDGLDNPITCGANDGGGDGG